jgi:uncharacterized membrane protein
MNKEIFINELKKELRDFNENEINDIVFEYETEIDEQIARGIPETDVINKLGNPRDIASEFLSNKEPNVTTETSTDADKTKNIVIFSLFQLFNIVFVLWFYFTLIALELTLMLSIIATVTFSIWSAMYFSLFEFIYSMTLTIFLVSLFILILILMIKYTKKYYIFNKQLYRRIK